MYIENNSSIEIKLPENISNNYNSLDKFISIVQPIREVKNMKIIFNCKHTKWFDANLSALWGSLMIDILENKNTISIHRLNNDIGSVLKKNGFLKAFGITPIKDVNNTTVNFEVLRGNKKTAFQEYMDRELFPHISINMTENFKNVLSSSLDELFQNARTHGKANRIIVCGQEYPRRQALKFTIVNKGITIPENVQVPHPEHNSPESIEWATRLGTSTKDLTKESGGYGLFNLVRFIKLNKGKLEILSGDGYFKQYCQNQYLKHLSSTFKGTIVNLEINLDDNALYISNEDIEKILKLKKDNNILENLF